MPLTSCSASGLLRRDPAEIRLHDREPGVRHGVRGRRRIVVRARAGRKEPRQVHGGRLAHLRDAEAVEHLGERAPHARPLDRCVQVLRALPPEALQALELVHGEGEEVGPTVDHARARGVGSGPPNRRPRCPCRRDPRSARTPGTASPGRLGSGSSGGPRRRPGRLPCRRRGTAAGTSYSRASVGPLLEDRPDDLRDHVAGLLEDRRCRRSGCPCACTSSRLWRVARATVEPATFAGRRCATGVSVPVRPT